MNSDVLQKLLVRPIAFHRVFADIAGSVTAGLFLSQAFYWTGTVQGTPERDGWFYKTADEWTEETALSQREQESARRRLRDIGVLQEQRIGMPAKLWYKVDLERLAELVDGRINLIREKRESRMAENANQDSTKTRSIHNRDYSIDYIQRTEIDKSISGVQSERDRVSLDVQETPQVDARATETAAATVSSISHPDRSLKAGRGRAARTDVTIPDDFEVTEALRETARKLGLSDVSIDAETEQFRDYHAARGTRFKDWAAAWRTWMRNVIKYAPKGVNGNGENFTTHRSGGYAAATGARPVSSNADRDIIERRTQILNGRVS